MRPKGLASFTQWVKVRRGKLVLALPSIRFSWNFYHFRLTLLCPFRANNHFCLKWSKVVQMGSKGPQMVINTWAGHFGLFLTLLNHFGTLTILPCLAIFGPKWSFFGPSPVMNGGPQSKNKAHHQVSYVWPWKNRRFLPLSCHEWQVMGPKEVFYSCLVTEMTW